MRYEVRLALACRLTLLWLPLAGAGCAATKPIVISPSACSGLIPEAWRLGVPGAAPYGPAPSAGDLVAFGDAQTAALDKANGRTADSLAIVEKCEARDRRSLEKFSRPWWRF